METKKKLKNFLSFIGIFSKGFILLLLVLNLLVIFSSTCLASDYDDFNLPVEFWEAYIDYFDTYLIPRKADFPPTSCPVTASQLRDYWNTNLADYTKNYFEQYGADLRHLCLVTSFGGGTYFNIYPYFMNNTIGNVDNYCTFYFTNTYYNCSRNSNITGRVFGLTVNTNGTLSNFKNNSFSSTVYTYTSSDDFDISTSSCYGPFFGVNSAPLNTVQVNNVPNTNNTQWHLKGYYNLFAEPEPEEPSGDTSGDTSGDVPVSPSGESGGGTIDYTNQLNNINTSINSLQNQISGDTQSIINQISGETNKVIGTLTDSATDTINSTNISSGDIYDTVDFSPINQSSEYSVISNLWFNLLTGFSNSLTDVNRTLPIEFRGEIYNINLDDFSVFIPDSLKIFFGTLSTVFVVIYISKNTKHIIEDVQTASIDNVANSLTDDFETNMF